jgi:hypothetical protein
MRIQRGLQRPCKASRSQGIWHLEKQPRHINRVDCDQIFKN